MRGQSMPSNSSHRRWTSNGRQCSKIGHAPNFGASAAWVASKASLSVPPRGVHLADLLAHDEQEVAGLLDGGVDRLAPARHRAAAADQGLGAEASTRSRVPVDQSVWKASPV